MSIETADLSAHPDQELATRLAELGKTIHTTLNGDTNPGEWSFLLTVLRPDAEKPAINTLSNRPPAVMAALAAAGAAALKDTALEMAIRDIVKGAQEAMEIKRAEAQAAGATRQ